MGILHSCYLGPPAAGDIHPDYTHVLFNNDSAGFHFKHLPIGDEENGVPLFIERMIGKELYYYTDFKTRKQNNKSSVDRDYGGAYYNKKGVKLFEIDLDKIIPDMKKSISLLRGTTKDGKFVIRINNFNDQRYLLYDCKKGRVTDTIDHVYYSYLLELAEPWEHDYEPFSNIDSTLSLVSNKWHLPLPVLLPVPEKEDYPTDSTGVLQYKEDVEKYKEIRKKYNQKYLHDFVNSAPGFIYSINTRDDLQVIVNTKKKVALTFFRRLDGVDFIKDLPEYCIEPLLPEKAEPGELFEIEKSGSSLYEVRRGGGLNPWHQHYMSYYDLIYQQKDTVRLKGMSPVKIHDYTKVNGKYILILDVGYYEGGKYVFFEYTPLSE